VIFAVLYEWFPYGRTSYPACSTSMFCAMNLFVLWQLCVTVPAIKRMTWRWCSCPWVTFFSSLLLVSTVQFRLIVTSFFCTNQGNEQFTTGFCFANGVTISFVTAMPWFHFYICTSEYHPSSAAWVLNMQHKTTEGTQWCPLHYFSMPKLPCLEGRYLRRKEKGDVGTENWNQQINIPWC
jgi:hypothetical protein